MMGFATEITEFFDRLQNVKRNWTNTIRRELKAPGGLYSYL
jgi:hypothetical protein